MDTGGAVGSGLVETARDEPETHAEVVAEPGDIEIVTTSSGAVLHIFQSRDE